MGAVRASDVHVPELGEPKVGEPERTYQEVISVSGCGFKWRAYLPRDARGAGREVGVIMAAHRTVCRDCAGLAARAGTPL